MGMNYSILLAVRLNSIAIIETLRRILRKLINKTSINEAITFLNLLMVYMSTTYLNSHVYESLITVYITEIHSKCTVIDE